MDALAFAALCEPAIAVASGDATAAGIRLGHCTSDIEQKVRRIVTAGGYHNSDSERQVEIGIRIAATALAMMGARPISDDIRHLLRS
jgi:hypothetical protein